MDVTNFNRINVLLDASTIEIIKKLAKYNNVSLSSVCAYLIKRQLEEDDIFNVRISQPLFLSSTT